jgi:hypothetical protein
MMCEGSFTDHLLHFFKNFTIAFTYIFFYLHNTEGWDSKWRAVFMCDAWLQAFLNRLPRSSVDSRVAGPGLTGSGCAPRSLQFGGNRDDRFFLPATVAKLQQFRLSRFHASRWRANLTYNRPSPCISLRCKDSYFPCLGQWRNKSNLRFDAVAYGG